VDKVLYLYVKLNCPQSVITPQQVVLIY